MSTATATPAATARHGFDTLDQETHLDGLPVQGKLRPGSRDRCFAPGRPSGRSATAP